MTNHLDTQPKFQVLLSYCGADRAAVRTVYKKLRESRINAWMDVANIRPGEEWEPAIERALKSSALVLVFISQNSVVNSGYSQKEIHAALEAWKEKPPGAIFLIPVRLEPCTIDERLAKFHWINLFEEYGWTRLLDQINGLKQEIPSDAAEVKSERCPQSHGDTKPPRSSDPGLKKEIPMITFPREVRRFVFDCVPVKWARLTEEVRLHILGLGCKLEPIVQIVPAMALPVPIGFECLALSSAGESFQQVCERCSDLEPGVLRLCMAVAAVQTISALRREAASTNLVAARNLILSINLDPFMLDSPYLTRFLNQYDDVLRYNVIFEVNETTTKQYLRRPKNLQVDFNLRFSADDLNNWHPEVRAALIDRVEMTKMDYRSFAEAMHVRADDPKKAINLLRANSVAGKPLIVEGIQDEDYIQFLERHWKFRRRDHLYGQGYALDSGMSWGPSVRPLKNFGIQGGSFVCSALALNAR